MNKSSLPGRVWLVGAGPGDPELLTVKATRVLCMADVWLVDDLVSPDVYAYARSDAVIEAVGKRGGRCSTSQQHIQESMLAFALSGRSVARVKGGDPLLFGRGGEEADYLRAHGITVEVVNGITSGTAAAEALGIALTHRDHGHGVTFITAHTANDAGPDWHSLVSGGTTLVIYMGMSRLLAIRDDLLAASMDPDMPAAVVMNATRVDERHWTGTLSTLGEALNAGLCSPAIILIGGVVAHAQRLPVLFESRS